MESETDKNMNYTDVCGFGANASQCFVCERPTPGDCWFAQVKHGDLTIQLCCPRCAKAFYAQRLPGLRRIQFLAALQSLQWPRQPSALVNEL